MPAPNRCPCVVCSGIRTLLAGTAFLTEMEHDPATLSLMTNVGAFDLCARCPCEICRRRRAEIRLLALQEGCECGWCRWIRARQPSTLCVQQLGARSNEPTPAVPEVEEVINVVAKHCARCGRAVVKAVLGLPKKQGLKRFLRTFCSQRCLKAARRFKACRQCGGRGWTTDPDVGPERITCGVCFGAGWRICEVCGVAPAVKTDVFAGDLCGACAPRKKEKSVVAP